LHPRFWLYDPSRYPRLEDVPTPAIRSSTLTKKPRVIYRLPGTGLRRPGIRFPNFRKNLRFIHQPLTFPCTPPRHRLPVFRQPSTIHYRLPTSRQSATGNCSPGGGVEAELNLTRNTPLLAANRSPVARPCAIRFPPLVKIYALFTQAAPGERILFTAHREASPWDRPLTTVNCSGGGFEAELNLTRVSFLSLRSAGAMIHHPSARLFRPVRPFGLVRLLGHHIRFPTLAQNLPFICQPLPSLRTPAGHPSPVFRPSPRSPVMLFPARCFLKSSATCPIQIPSCI
jgi:hypothetical protein